MDTSQDQTTEPDNQANQPWDHDLDPLIQKEYRARLRLLDLLKARFDDASAADIAALYTAITDGCQTLSESYES